eukprot:6173681-Pleurochrysis_carterae.AAC.1
METSPTLACKAETVDPGDNPTMSAMDGKSPAVFSNLFAALKKKPIQREAAIRPSAALAAGVPGVANSLHGRESSPGRSA